MFNVETYAYHGPALMTARSIASSIQRPRRQSPGCRRHQRLDRGAPTSLRHRHRPREGQPYRFTLNSAPIIPTGGRGPGSHRRSRRVGQVRHRHFRGTQAATTAQGHRARPGAVTDYGYLYVLAQPLFIVLDAVDSFFGNWGVAIILVTFLLSSLSIRCPKPVAARWPR